MVHGADRMTDFLETRYDRAIHDTIVVHSRIRPNSMTNRTKTYL